MEATDCILKNEMDEILKLSSQSSKDPLIEGIDFHLDETGMWMLTAEYLLKRGFCCHHGCKYCPYILKG